MADKDRDHSYVRGGYKPSPGMLKWVAKSRPHMVVIAEISKKLFEDILKKYQFELDLNYNYVGPRLCFVQDKDLNIITIIGRDVDNEPNNITIKGGKPEILETLDMREPNFFVKATIVVENILKNNFPNLPLDNSDSV